MNTTTAIGLAISLAMLIGAYLMLSNAQRRLEDAMDYHRECADALAEAKRINDESTALHHRVTAMLKDGAL